MEGLNFREALEHLAEKHGIPLPQPTKEQTQQQKIRFNLYEVVELACRYYISALHRHQGARDYLDKRGILPETIENFRLGYAPAVRPQHFIDWFRDKGIDAEKLHQAGLMIKTDEGRALLRFQNRIIFPIFNMKNQVIAFGGRLLSGEGAKYINAPETPLFSKGEELYNQARMRGKLAKGASPLLVEGYMDCIILDQAGIGNVVAPLGTSVTEYQLSKLWRLGAEPILCFDGDQAGVNAAYRAAKRALPLLKPSHTLWFSFLPQGQDPDSFVRQGGRKAFDSCIEKAKSLYEVLWQQETHALSFETPEARAGLEQKMMRYVEEIKDRVIANHYRKIFKDLLWHHFRLSSHHASQKDSKGIPPKRDDKRRFHQILLVTLCHHPDLIDQLEERLVQEIFDRDLDKCFEMLQKLRLDFPDADGKTMRRNVLQNEENLFSSLLCDGRVSRLAPFSRLDSSFEDALGGVATMLKLHQVNTLDHEINALRGDGAQLERRFALHHERTHTLEDALKTPFQETETPK